MEGLNAEMLWTMMYIYGNLDYPVVVVSDLRIKSNESLGLNAKTAILGDYILQLVSTT